MISIGRQINNKLLFELSLYTKDHKFLGKITKISLENLASGYIKNEVVLDPEGNIITDRKNINSLIDSAEYFILSNNAGILLSITDFINIESIKHEYINVADDFTVNISSKELYSREKLKKLTKNNK